jgi:hypothetical protein
VTRRFRPLAFLKFHQALRGSGAAVQDDAASASAWRTRATFLQLLPPQVHKDLEACFRVYLEAAEAARNRRLACVGAWLPAGLPAARSPTISADSDAAVQKWASTPRGAAALQYAATASDHAALDSTGAVQVWRIALVDGDECLVPLAWTVETDEEADQLRASLELFGQELQGWADRYNIGTPWVLDWALKSIVHSGNDVRVYNDGIQLGVQPAEWRSLTDTVQDVLNGDGEAAVDVIPLPNPLRETREQAKARYLRHFQRAWERAEAEARVRGLQPARQRRGTSASNRQVQWVVDYYCKDQTMEAVAEAHDASVQAVSKTIRELAVLLDLPPRRAKRQRPGTRNASAKNRLR